LNAFPFHGYGFIAAKRRRLPLCLVAMRQLAK